MLIRLFKNNKGFTLIELMIVITIIAILATIGIMSFTRVQRQARDTKRKAEIKTLQTALQAYYIDKQVYPISAASADVATALTALAPNYVGVLPVSPTGVPAANANGIVYKYISSDGSKYGLCAGLETSTVTGTLDGASMFWATTQSGGGKDVIAAACTEL